LIKRHEAAAAKLKAASHPLRLALLDAVAAGHDSPSEAYIALRTSDPQLNLSLVAYHITILRKQNLIHQTRVEKGRRGAEQHFYEVTETGRLMLSLVKKL
jgi:DNA-binding transcriptional ArsR family regulator